MSTYLENLFSLKNKMVLITGAAGGIGSAFAKAMIEAGAKVACCDINREGLENLKETLGENAFPFYLNMTARDTFKETVEEIAQITGRIDVLINSAGINKREGFVDVEEETYDRIMDINLKGAFFLTQAVAPYMKAQEGGSIINIGSHNTGAILGGVSVYGASKSALMSLTRSQAVEWAKYNIRANCLSPGHIKTELTTVTWEHPKRSKYLLERIALDRPGYPEDLVGLAILLASDASAYITGQEFRIDGGFLAGGKPWEYDSRWT